MNTAHLALERAQLRLVERLDLLETRLAAGGEESVWLEYGQLAAALAAIAPLTTPGAGGRAMTTKELAAAFHLTERVARRKGLRGELPVGPIRLGTGDRAKLRWAAR